MTQDSSDNSAGAPGATSTWLDFTKIKFAGLAIAALLAGLWFGGVMTPAPERDLATVGDDARIPGGFAYPKAKDIVAFQLTDHDGQVFDIARFKDKWTFVYLGYTYCPDVCPVTLNELNRVDQHLSESGGNQDVQYVFVSVDPVRDTLARLKEYTEYFNPKFVSATSSNPDQLQTVARNLAMLFVPVKEDQEGTDYLVDHSSSVALVGPDAKLHALFTAPQKAEELAASLIELRARRTDTAS